MFCVYASMPSKGEEQQRKSTILSLHAQQDSWNFAVTPDIGLRF
jgi:hypothetical protein